MRIVSRARERQQKREKGNFQRCVIKRGRKIKDNYVFLKKLNGIGAKGRGNLNREVGDQRSKDLVKRGKEKKGTKEGG